MKKLDLSAGGHPERTWVGKDTSVQNVADEIARLTADLAEAERMRDKYQDVLVVANGNCARRDEKITRLTQRSEELENALHRIAHGHDEHAAITGAEREDRDREDCCSWVLGWAQGVARQALGEEQNEWTRVPLAFAEKKKI